MEKIQESKLTERYKNIPKLTEKREEGSSSFLNLSYPLKFYNEPDDFNPQSSFSKASLPRPQMGHFAEKSIEKPFESLAVATAFLICGKLYCFFRYFSRLEWDYRFAFFKFITPEGACVCGVSIFIRNSKSYKMVKLANGKFR